MPGDLSLVSRIRGDRETETGRQTATEIKTVRDRQAGRQAATKRRTNYRYEY